jgi:hypothetical protein
VPKAAKKYFLTDTDEIDIRPAHDTRGKTHLPYDFAARAAFCAGRTVAGMIPCQPPPESMP